MSPGSPDGIARLRVLAADDQPENLELLAAILGDEGFEMRFARDGVEALDAISADPPDAVLLDVMMPRLDGFQVCGRIKRSRATCFIPVVLLTALSDVESRIRGLEAGADDFLNKPFHRAELLTRLRSLLRIRALRDELDSTEAVIFSMVDLLEGKDPRTRHHSLRVAALATATGRALGFDDRALQDLAFGALLHDIGKIGVPESILLKAESERGAEEEALYRSHPGLGRRILEPISSLAGALPIVLHHHERADGSGYPGGLAAPDLPRAVELVAAANAFDLARIAHGGDVEAAAAELSSETSAGRFGREISEGIAGIARSLPGTPNLAGILPVPVAESGGSILVADDSPTNRQLYVEMLEAEGFAVEVVADGNAALAAWRAGRPDLLLVDVRMPGLSGDELCRRVKSDPASAFLPVVLVTAYEERDSRQRAVEAGADDLLVAPVDRLELLTRIRSLLRLRVYHQDLVLHESVVVSLSAALEAKDAYTRGHSQRVGALSARLAIELGERREEADRLRLGGLLHDIGKVAVPESILHKPGRLTDEEFRQVMTHPVVGWEICRRLRSAQPVLDVIRWHHERFDGSGYPDGLAGKAIPWSARILSLADALDALTSERPYRASLSVADGLELLRRETRRGKWDVEVLAALDRLHDRGEADPRRAEQL
ncbi:MAG: response regulator [Thermoanaerobaculia bacterium]|nr:MAG: response regulator [Thermoanaerobaculia bacterium]